MLAKSSFGRSQSGFSLVETIVATALLATALVALAELFGVAIRSNAIAKNGSMTMILAQQKMEQLKGLAWGYDLIGLPVSDSSTDTAQVPESAIGGRGLSPSPANALSANTDGYVDYIDAIGRSLGGGGAIPLNTAYSRRWSIEPLPTNPNNTLIIQVLVTRRTDRGTSELGSVQRLPEEARLIGVKTRKTQ